jgi:hypothetical protein
MARPEQDLVPAGTVATANTTYAQSTGVGNASAVRAQLNVTAAAGTTPTLDVVIEDSLDGQNWNTVGTFAQKTAAAREVINITAPFADRLRARATVGGTGPSFTFGVRIAAIST